LLTPYVEEHRLGSLLIAPADVIFSPRRGVQPDLFVVPLVSGNLPNDWQAVRQMRLAVEVISPSTSISDRVKKRKVYQEEGVPDYWIVDLDARLIERWRSEDTRPEILTDAIDWQPSEAHPPLSIDLPGFFRRVDGD
jgi:Uma2 family endonuclease